MAVPQPRSSSTRHVCRSSTSATPALSTASADTSISSAQPASVSLSLLLVASMRGLVSVTLLSLVLIVVTAVSCDASPFRRSAFRDPVTAGYGRRSSAATAASLQRDSPYNWSTLYYEQQLVDHFGWDQKATFTQKSERLSHAHVACPAALGTHTAPVCCRCCCRYLINADSWTPLGSAAGPGPIFFYCGNEGWHRQQRGTEPSAPAFCLSSLC